MSSTRTLALAVSGGIALAAVAPLAASAAPAAPGHHRPTHSSHGHGRHAARAAHRAVAAERQRVTHQLDTVAAHVDQARSRIAHADLTGSDRKALVDRLPAGPQLHHLRDRVQGAGSVGRLKAVSRTVVSLVAATDTRVALVGDLSWVDGHSDAVTSGYRRLDRDARNCQADEENHRTMADLDRAIAALDAAAHRVRQDHGALLDAARSGRSEAGRQAAHRTAGSEAGIRHELAQAGAALADLEKISR